MDVKTDINHYITFNNDVILPPCHKKTCGFFWGHAHESGLHLLLLSWIFWSSWLDYLSLQDHTFVLLFKAGFFSLFRRLWGSCAPWFKRIFLVALCSSWIFFHVIWTKEKIQAQELGKSDSLALHARIWEQRGQLNPDSKIPPFWWFWTHEIMDTKSAAQFSPWKWCF